MIGSSAQGPSERQRPMAYKIDRLESSTGRVSWRVRWRFGGTRDGAWQSVTLDSHTDAKALKAGVEVLRDRIKRDDPSIVDRSIITGVKRAAHDSGPLWEDVSTEWLLTRGGIRGQSMHLYKQVLRDHLSRWNGRAIASISKVDVATLVNDYQIVRSGRGASNFDVAAQVFEYAVSKGLRPDNPARRMKLHAKGESVAVFLSSEDVDLLSAAAAAREIPVKRVGRPWAELPPDWSLIVATTLGTGMRLSEVSAIQVRDLNLTPGRASISIRRAWRRDPVKGLVIMPTKSGASTRVVAIVDELADALRAHVRDRRQLAYVFAHVGKVTPVEPHTVSKAWRRTVARAESMGLEQHPRFHDLRHTHASDLLTRGVSMQIVSRRLGHSSITVTDKFYCHLSPDSDDVVRAAMSGEPDDAPRLRAV